MNSKFKSCKCNSKICLLDDVNTWVEIAKLEERSRCLFPIPNLALFIHFKNHLHATSSSAAITTA